MLNTYKFIAENARLNLIEALEKTYKLGQKDERSKVNKAIEEIEEYLMEDTCGGEHEKGVMFALEILKRNIGDEEND